jgi:hypothetical protein
VLHRYSDGERNVLFEPFIYNNVHFCAIYIIYKRSFYQDRLGTNIGKALQKVRFLSQGPGAPTTSSPSTTFRNGRTQRSN